MQIVSYWQSEEENMRCPYCNAIIQERTIGGRQYCSECFRWITPESLKAPQMNQNQPRQTQMEQNQINQNRTELPDLSHMQQTDQSSTKIQCAFCRHEIYDRMGNAERIRCPYCHRMNFISEHHSANRQSFQPYQVNIQRKSTDGIEYEIENDEAVVVAYWGEEKQLIVGDEYNGRAITRIKENALKGNRGLESVLLGKNIRIVEREAFADCINLKKLKIEGEIAEIQEGAFFRCVSLSQIQYKQVPNVVAVSAFAKCYNIPTETREQLAGRQ